MRKLAIISTHPIQYYAPVFRMLAQVTEIKVFYTWGKTAQQNYDPDFQRQIIWDIPLLEGYPYEWVTNTAQDPGSHHRKGIVNPDLNQKILAFQPDAVLIYGWNYESHWKAMRYFKGKIPIWFRGDSTLLNEKGGIKSLLKKVYLSWVYRHVDKAFYVGTANKAYFKYYGLQEEQLIFAPHAVDNDRFADDRSVEVKTMRESLGIHPQDRLILFAGKLELNKNPVLLLDAFIQLHATESSIKNQDARYTTHLMFVGNGVLEDQLKAKADEFNHKIASCPKNKQSSFASDSYRMTGTIHFLSFQNQTQMPVIYQACDLFCLPSQSETWGLAVNEAMAAGKAIIVSSQVGCASDLVTDGANGYIFKSGNLESLTEKLDLVLHNQIEYLGQRSSKMIQCWSIETQTEKYLDLLET